MEFEDQEEQEEELCMGGGGGAGYDPTRMKVPLAAEPVRSSSSNGGGGARARYRECLKNHAVGIGGHALDGCGEFMAAGTEGTLDALKCAACSCHRNFHRKEADSSAVVLAGGDPFLLQHHHHPPPQFAAYYRHPTGYLHVGGQHRGAAGTLALPSTSGGGGTQSTREDQEDVSNPSAGGGTGSKKRFRTKFTVEQKDKMLELAEKLGWRIQKHDEAVVQAFCNETGVKRHVLKVWMHNNKHTLDVGTRKKQKLPR